MIIYSVTVRIKKDCENEWLSWMKDVHIQNVLKTNYFNGYNIFKVLVPEVEEDVSIYKIKYELEDFEKYKAYSSNDAIRLQSEHKDKFHGKIKASREVMQKI